MNVAKGGYYTEGRVVDPLRTGAASFVIYANGSVNVGAWGSDLSMTSRVVSVRQKLGATRGRRAPHRGRESELARVGFDVRRLFVRQVSSRHRSSMEIGVGITANGALIYVTGPALSPYQLASCSCAPASFGDGTRHKFELARLFDVRSTRGERPRVAVKREQAHCVNRARSLDVLRIYVAARFHHECPHAQSP